MCIIGMVYKWVRVWAQACDSHPYSTYCFFVEEMNKRDIAYIHMVEPRAKGKEGAASPIAEFANEHRDETLDARPGLAACPPVTRAAATHIAAYACLLTPLPVLNTASPKPSYLSPNALMLLDQGEVASRHHS